MLSLNHIITVCLSAFSSFGPGGVLMSCYLRWYGSTSIVDALAYCICPASLWFTVRGVGNLLSAFARSIKSKYR
jgi:hypothetical protein